ncbi:S-adenosyl-L-methionine-dependent methyltransferase [Hyaloscypha variabilis F]|uniref:S-adenosyl-L-methionine-dependent methyltransferase n=1 Tax=Hyaloscypha variabilis (strain UAMH 11265 / GT02V1 / F) TaxID=1149755 RepID=A0A2J6RU40_HYAVF|nr:S-adenosyl-L-methionine-dependent methyltransferase [Hyaloscypha variabilis F]
MNNPESQNQFVPKQAIAPTPELYDELVIDCMEKLAAATVSHLTPFPNGAKIHDNGCGTGAATAAIMSFISPAAKISINGTDINSRAIEIYKRQAAEKHWPATAVPMDSTALSYASELFTHSIGNALLFVLPNDGVDAVKEVYRTLKPGGIAALNSWAYQPNMEPIQVAAQSTRPAGTPLPRQGMDKWLQAEFLQSVVEKGGFERQKIKMVQSEVFVELGDLNRYATMLWSFIGGTSAVGWLESDEQKWEEAITVVKKELKKSQGTRLLDGGKMQLRFVANIAIATK